MTERHTLSMVFRMEQSSNVGKDFEVAALSWHSDRREVFLDQNFPVFVSLEGNSIVRPGGPIGSSFPGPGSPPLTTCDSRPGGTASFQIRGSLRPDQLRRLRRLDVAARRRTLRVR